MTLKGKMINITAETPNSRQTNLNIVKEVVAGDLVTGKKLYKDPETFRPYAKHFLAMNEIPSIDDTSLGMQRRIYVVEFLRTFEQTEMITDMEARLKTELAGIFNWAIEGLDRLKENNFIFTTSESLVCAKNKYKNISSNLYEFIETCIRPVPSARTPWKDVFSCYQKFCDDLKYTQLPKRDLKTAFEGNGYKVDNSTIDNNQVCVFGVELAE